MVNFHHTTQYKLFTLWNYKVFPLIVSFQFLFSLSNLEIFSPGPIVLDRCGVPNNCPVLFLHPFFCGRNSSRVFAYSANKICGFEPKRFILLVVCKYSAGFWPFYPPRFPLNSTVFFCGMHDENISKMF